MKLTRDRFEKLTTLLVSQRWLLDREAAVTALHDVCTSETSFDTAVELLRRFTFFQQDEARKHVSLLADAAVSDFGLIPSKTVFTGLSDPNRTNSGQTILNWIRNHLAGSADWQASNFPSIGVAAHNLKDGDTLVFADDFIGTGDSLTDSHDYVAKKLASRGVANVRFAVLALAAMEGAKSDIHAPVGPLAKIGFWLKRGISDHYTGSALVDAIAGMKEAEGNLFPTDGKKLLPSFGYGSSESLYAIDAVSVPDNVFPLFWWRFARDGSRRKTLLARA